MKRSIFLSFLLTALWLAPATFAAGPVNVCQLVTSEEIGAILQAKVGPPIVVTAPRPHCTYAVEGKGMLKTVAIWAYHEGAKASFENGKTGLAPIQAVPGLGDEAYFGMMLLNVLKKDIYVQVQLIFPKGVNALEVEKQIAEKLLPRLP